MEIMDYEIKRHTQWSEDIANKKIKDDAKAEKRFNAFVAKQEQALRVSIYLLLNFCVNIYVPAIAILLKIVTK